MEEVTGVDLFADVVEDGVVAVCEDAAAFGLELGEVVNDAASEEGAAVFEGRFVDDDAGTLRLDALHDALDRGLAEVVGVRLHGQAIHTDDGFLLEGLLLLVVACIGLICVGDFEHAVCDEVLPGAITLDDRLDQVLRDVLVVREKLLRVLREAVAAVAEGWVVIEVADARVEADAVDDLLGVEALRLGVGVELVEVGHAEREVGVREELDGLGFGEAHEEGTDAGFDRAFLEEGGEAVRGVDGGRVVFVTGHDDPGRVEVVVEGLRLAEELRGEEDAAGAVLRADRGGVADRDRGLDEHVAVVVARENLLDHAFDGARVEVVLLAVVVRRCRDDDEIRGRVGSVGRVLQANAGGAVAGRCGVGSGSGVGGGGDRVLRANAGGAGAGWGGGGCGSCVRAGAVGVQIGVQDGVEVEPASAGLRLGEELLDVLVLDRADPGVKILYLLLDDVDCGDVIMLCEQRRERQTDVARSGYHDVHR